MTERKFELTEKGKKYCTGNAFVTYFDDELKKTIYNELMTKEQLLDHLINKGWPFNISLELIDQKYGGKTYAKLLTRWDEEKKHHWHVIAQLQGDHYLAEAEAYNY
jgi:hypothetical protein